MCSENTTSLGRKEDLFYPKKAGGGNFSASGVAQDALAQFSSVARLLIDNTSPTN